MDSLLGSLKCESKMAEGPEQPGGILQLIDKLENVVNQMIPG